VNELNRHGAEPKLALDVHSALSTQHSALRSLFLCLICVLLGFGVLMVHSASITSKPTDWEEVYLRRHLMWLAVGVVSAAVAARMPSRFWRQAAPWLFLVTVILLAAVLVPGIGRQVKGAQRWIRYGSFSIQPSELAKITLTLFMCYLVDRLRPVLQTWVRGTVPVVLPLVVVVPLVLLQPDLGTCVFLATAGATALFVGGWPVRNFVLGGAAVVPAFIAVVQQKPYMMQRITGFVATWTDLNAAPYQLKQSLVTLGTGGLWGSGLGKGWQKLSFLPEANTDFVFAVIGEELGLLGTLSVVGLWLGLFFVGLRMLRPLDRASFEYVAGFTLLTQLVLQAALNVAVVTAMVPPKGISHPLLSCGGSNLVVSLTALGIFLSLTRQRDSNAP
jgi:cell division protein FtsW